MKIVSCTRSLDPDPVPPSRILRQKHLNELKRLRPNPTTLTADQQEQVFAFWKRYTIMEDTGWIDFYHKRTGVFDPKFIPHDLYYAEIDRVLNPPFHAVGIDDKTLYHRLFPGIRQPRILVSKAGDSLWSEDFCVLTMPEAIALCENEGRVICKLPILSCGGSGVRILDLPADTPTLRMLLMRHERIIIQEIVQQHQDTAVFHPESVNTLRIMTWLRPGGGAEVVSAVLRMGCGAAQVDNVSSGGCACGLLADGALKAVGCSKEGYLLDRHPSGIPFAGHHITGYINACKMVCKLHCTIPQFGLIAWDIAIAPNGEPILIELNLNNASIDFMQLCNGPLFGAYTEEILSQAYRIPVSSE